MLTRYYEPKKQQRYKWTFVGENSSGKMIIPEMTVMMTDWQTEVPPSSRNNLKMKFRRLEKSVCQDILDRMNFARMGSLRLWAVSDEDPKLVEKWDLDGISIGTSHIHEESMPLQTMYLGIVEIDYFDAYRAN